MTEQWKQAMEQLYAMESKSCTSRYKQMIDEALDQMLKWTESTRVPEELVKNALHNAKKRVSRHENRLCALDEAIFVLAAPSEFEEKVVELKDLVAHVDLTVRERSVIQHCGQGYRVQEIANEQGTSDKAIYHLRDRGRAKIRAALKKAA